jgi:hypothetical protein
MCYKAVVIGINVVQECKATVNKTSYILSELRISDILVGFALNTVEPCSTVQFDFRQGQAFFASPSRLNGVLASM